MEHEHTHEHTHVYTHEHAHSHEDGQEHIHEHEHSHSHEHETPKEETVALLKYMVDHNIHHAAELEELAHDVGGEAGHRLLHAIETFHEANHQLQDALDLLLK